MDMAIYSLITMILFEEEEFDQSIRDDINRECDAGLLDTPPIIDYPEIAERTDDYKVTYTSRAQPSYAAKMKTKQAE